MTSLRLRASMALAFAAFTAACGGGDGGAGPSFPDSVSTADAQDFADGVADYADYVASAMNFGGPSIALAGPAIATRLNAAIHPLAVNLPGVRFAPLELGRLTPQAVTARVQGLQLSATGCTTTIRGSYDPYGETPVDDNNNDIADDFYIKIVCETTDSVGGDTVVTQTVTQEVSWKEITTSLYGQVITYHVAQDAHDNHGRYQFIHYDVNGKQDIRADGIVDQASFKARQETNIGGDVLFEEGGESWDNGFDPATAIALGGNIPDGDLTIGGHRYYANSDDQNLSFGIHTTDPLAYSAACAGTDTNPPFTDGTLVGNLNNSSSQASFTIDFTSCGNYTVAVNGAYDEPVVVSARR